MWDGAVEGLQSSVCLGVGRRMREDLRPARWGGPRCGRALRGVSARAAMSVWKWLPRSWSPACPVVCKAGRGGDESNMPSECPCRRQGELIRRCNRSLQTFSACSNSTRYISKRPVLVATWRNRIRLSKLSLLVLLVESTVAV